MVVLSGEEHQARLQGLVCVGALIGASAAEFVLKKRGWGLFWGSLAECTEGRAHIWPDDWWRVEEVGKGCASGYSCAGVTESADVVVVVVFKPAVSMGSYGAAYFTGFGGLGAGGMRSFGCRAACFA